MGVHCHWDCCETAWSGVDGQFSTSTYRSQANGAEYYCAVNGHAGVLDKRRKSRLVKAIGASLFLGAAVMSAVGSLIKYVSKKYRRENLSHRVSSRSRHAPAMASRSQPGTVNQTSHHDSSRESR